MRVLVTGTSGYVGGAFAERLASVGHEVIATRHRTAVRVDGADVVGCDILETADVRRALRDVDAVVHCAALVGSGHRSRDLWNVNVKGTANVLEGALESEVDRFVHVSSTCVMDEYVDHEGSDEGRPYPERPRDVYTASKVEAERLVMGRSDGMVMTVLRPGWVWGPGAPGMLGILRMLDRGLFPVPGRGTNRLHLVYRDNLAQVIVPAVEGAPGGVYIVTDGSAVEAVPFLRQLADHLGGRPRIACIPFGLAYAVSALTEPLARATGLRLPTRLQTANLGKDHAFVTGKAERGLRYAPEVSLDEGTRRTVEWYRGLAR